MPVWWTNRSLSPSSGVMKPNPLSSLNHFTVPVGMWELLHGYVLAAARRMLLRASTCERLHHFCRFLGRPDTTTVARRPRSVLPRCEHPGGSPRACGGATRLVLRNHPEP